MVVRGLRGRLVLLVATQFDEEVARLEHAESSSSSSDPGCLRDAIYSVVFRGRTSALKFLFCSGKERVSVGRTVSGRRALGCLGEKCHEEALLNLLGRFHLCFF